MNKPEPKYDVKEIKNILIPMSDGVTLAADLLLPDSPGKFPVLLSYYPYHKDGMGKSIVAEESLRIVQKGYAHVFLDMRGCGNSEGAETDPMRRQEWKDGAEAVEWLARQPWSDGNVGMWGLSYGAETTMNVAAESPPHLKAIVPIMGCVNLPGFTHPGGAMRCFSTMVWFPWMIGMSFLPPLDTDVEGRWMKIWNEHLQHNREMHFRLYEHRTEDDYMLETSVLSRLGGIKTPAYVMGGWRDIFAEDMILLYSGIEAPKKLLMGPWKHGMPSWSVPEPNIDYFDEMMRWFDYWIKGIDTGVVDEPPIAIYTQKTDKWRYENEWPPARRNETILYLCPEGKLGLKTYDGKDELDSFSHDATVGTARGLENPGGSPLGLPLDQRVDEALSLTYTTEPMSEDTEITGAPVLTIFASTSADCSIFVAKLNDVAPDGSSSLITQGVLNVAYREGNKKILSVEPGEVYELSIKMCDTSYLVKAGHRLRLAIASSDFPFIWPTPKAAVNKVFHNQKYPSGMVIPFVPEPKSALPTPVLPEIKPPTVLPPDVEYSRPYWRIERDPVNSTVTVYYGDEEKSRISPTTTMEMLFHIKAVASALDPAGAYCSADLCFNIEGHKLGKVNVKANSRTTSEGGHSAVNIFVNDLLTFSKSWLSRESFKKK